MKEIRVLNNKMSCDPQKRKGLFKKVIMFALFLCIILAEPGMTKKSFADGGTQLVVTPNYIDETATITAAPGGSSRYYISIDNMRNWDMLDSNMVDISSLLGSKDTIIYFKGNKDTNPYPLTLQGEDKSLTASYKASNGVGRVEFTSGLPVEYRKGPNGVWKTATNPMPTSIYEIKGTSLYFRTAATAAKRAGRIVVVRVPKRPTAPSVRLDGSKLMITGMKPGETLYRVGDNAWTPFNPTDKSVRALDLSALLGGSTLTNVAIPAGTIEFRVMGNDKKANSAVKVLEVPQQTVLQQGQVTITGSSITVIGDANQKVQYEYTVLSGNNALNLNTARWSSITVNRTVTVPRVSIGDKILVRRKSTTDQVTRQIIPASTYIVLQVTGITTK